MSPVTCRRGGPQEWTLWRPCGLNNGFDWNSESIGATSRSVEFRHTFPERSLTSAFVTAVFLVASAIGGSTESLQAASPPGLALRGVTVIDPSEGSAASARRANLTVVLAGGRITQVGPTGSVVVPEGFVVIDAQGKYVIPGF